MAIVEAAAASDIPHGRPSSSLKSAEMRQTRLNRKQIENNELSPKKLILFLS
jgi:hypothetical protein